MYPLACQMPAEPAGDRDSMCATGGFVPASVLLISTDPGQQTSVGGVLRPPDYILAVANDADDAVATASEHDLLILDTSGDPETVLELCRRTRHDPVLMSIPLLCIGQSDDVEERIRFLEAGADDVIGRPYDERELEARVEALVARFQRSRALTRKLPPRDAPPRERRTVAVFSPKGGVGTTTIATNVAVVAATRHPQGVLLIDLDLQFGGVAVHLDLSPRQTIVDLVKDEPALSDPELLRGYATPHDSGLHVLAGTARPEQTELMSGDYLGQLLRTAALAYESVVVDAGSSLDDRSLQILEWADSVILPFHPEIPALKAVHSLLDYLNSTGSVVSKSIFVLNNAFARQALRMRDIELALGTRVAIELPYDPMAYLNAANEGVPIVIGSPRSAAAVRLSTLSGSVFGIDAVAAEAPASSGRGLGRLLRRSEGQKRSG
jgi:pilus assembly protein CpaE